MLKLLLPNPAVLINADRIKNLLISDIHIGWEIQLQKKGINIPSQTAKILNKLIGIIAKYKPERLIILGDVKYSVVSRELSEWQDIPNFFSKLQQCINNISILIGNHDANLKPLLPQNVKLLPATGTVIGNVGVFHGHKWPSPKLLGCKTLVMGHVHPSVVLRDPAGYRMINQVWIKVKCNTEILSKILLQKSKIKIVDSVSKTLEKQYSIKPKVAQILVMPSFNDFLGGSPVNETKLRNDIIRERFIGPVLRSEAVDADDAELYLLDGTYLGTLEQMRS